MRSRTSLTTRTSAAAAGLLAAALAVGAAPASQAVAPATAGTSLAASTLAADDILDQVRAVPGVTSVTEGAAPTGYRFFLMTFRQPRDHRNPAAGTFEQRITLLHKSTDRPMVMYTSGYGVSQRASRSEPTQIVDGNQLSMEYRFFTPSIPENPDWPKELTIWQAASDQHRIIEAFKTIYTHNWITTGGSKGGMTATYHRRFYPDDVQGTVPYVAPNDVIDDEDVYNDFLDTVGTDPACRDAITALQRRALSTDRTWYLERLAQITQDQGLTWDIVGSMEKAWESSIVDTYFAFWQYQPQSECANVPDAATATRDEVWDWFDAVTGLTFYSDQGVGYYTPYYYQASYQLGAPEPYESRIGDLLKFPGADVATTFVPAALKPITFDRKAMPDVDRWVSTRSQQMLYIYGSNDPWGAEAFDCGPTVPASLRDCYRFYVDGGTHGSRIAQLPADQKAFATSQILEWAGLASTDAASEQLARTGSPKAQPQLDRAPEWASRHRVG